MNSEFLEEEVRALSALPGFLREHFFVSKLPIFILFCYSLVMQNYISLGYFIFALILLNLENEDYYETNEAIFSKSESITMPLLEKMVKRKFYHPIVYHSLLLYSACAYLWKLVMVFFRHNIVATSDNNNDGYADFEFYLTADTSLIDMMMTFVPNFAIIVMALCSSIMRNYEININPQRFIKFKQAFFVKYALKPLVGILLLSLPITSLSLISLMYVTAVFASIALWSLNSSGKGFFYPYCKAIQKLSGVCLVLEYLGVIPSFQALNDEESVWNFNYIGINEMYLSMKSVRSFFFCVSLLLLYVSTNMFCNLKKKQQLIHVFKKKMADEDNKQLADAYKDESDISQMVSKNPSARSSFSMHTPLESNSVSLNQSKIEEPPKKEPKKDAKDPTKKKGLSSALKSTIVKIVAFFGSPFFILRVLQPITVWIVYRYQTIFSLFLTIWLFMASIWNDLEAIYRATVFLAAPSAVATFYTLYLANSGNNVIAAWPDWCGFIPAVNYSLEYVATFIYVFLLGMMIRVSQKHLNRRQREKTSRRVRRNNMEKTSETQPNKSNQVSFDKLVFAFLASYSFYISLIVLYWIGLSIVNFFHFGLTLFFVTFLVNPKVASKYWIFMLGYICVQIFIRYFYDLGTFTVDAASLSRKITDFIGISYPGHTPRSTTEAADDSFYNETILIWVLFAFTVFQYKTYQSSLFKQIGVNLQETILQQNFIKAKLPRLGDIFRWFERLYWKSLIWGAYFVIQMVLIFDEFNYLNAILYLVTTVNLAIQLYLVRTHGIHGLYKNYRLFQVVVIVNAACLTLRYVYFFRKFDLIATVFGWSPWNSNTSNANLLLVGFPDLNASVYSSLETNIVTLFFSVLAQSLYKMLNQYYNKFKFHQEGASEKKVETTSPPKKKKKEKKEKPVSLIKEQERNQIMEKAKKIVEECFLGELTRISDPNDIQRKLFAVLCHIWFNLIFVTVLFIALLFRLSFFNLIYLIIFVYYYQRLHSNFITRLERHQFLEQITRKVEKFLALNLNSKKRVSSKSLEDPDDHKIENEDTIANYTHIEVGFRRSLWGKLVLLTTIFMGLSYLCQHLNENSAFMVASTSEDMTGSIVFALQNSLRYFAVLWGFSLFGNYPAVGDLYPYFILQWMLALEVVCYKSLENFYKIKDPAPTQPADRKSTSHIEIEMTRKSSEASPTKDNGLRFSDSQFNLESSAKKLLQEEPPSTLKDLDLASPSKENDEVFDLFDDLNTIGSIGLDEKDKRQSISPLQRKKSTIGGPKSQPSQPEAPRKSISQQLFRSTTMRRKPTIRPMVDLNIEPKMEKILEAYIEDNEFLDDDQEAANLLSNKGIANLEKLNHRDLKSLLIKEMTIEEKKNLIEYYRKYRLASTIESRTGAIKLFERLVLLILFINSNYKRNVFSMISLIFAIYYWSKSKNFYYVRNLTTFFSIMMILQYVLLSLNLSYPFTSPYPLPSFTNQTMDYSILHQIVDFDSSTLTSPSQLLNFGGFGILRMDMGKNDTITNTAINPLDPITTPLPNTATSTLIGDSLVFLFVQGLLWLYLRYFQLVLQNLFRKAQDAAKKLADQASELINYQNWRDANYVALRFFTKFVYIHFQRVAIIVIISIALSDFLTMNLVIMIVAVYYLLLTEFIVNSSSIPNKQILMVKFLTFAQFFTLLYLLWASLNKLQFAALPIRTFNNETFTDYSAGDKIWMFVLLQLILDLLQSKNYVRINEDYYKKFSLRARMINLCALYDFNDKKIVEIIKNFANKRTLNERLESVSEQLKVWHEVFFEDKGKIKEKEQLALPEEASSPSQIVAKNANAEHPTTTNDKNAKKETKEMKKRIRDGLPGNTGTKVTMKKTFWENFTTFFRSKITPLRNPHYFSSLTELYSKIIQRNCNVINIRTISRTDYVFHDFTVFNQSLDDLDKFYYEFKKELLRNPGMTITEVYRKRMADIIEKHHDGLALLENGPSELEIQAMLPRSDSQSDVDDSELGVSKNTGKHKNISIAHKDRDLLGTVTIEKPLTITEIFMTLYQILLSNWTLFLYFNFIIYHFTRQGLLTAFIPYLFFGYAICEEIKPRYSTWKILFLGIAGIMIVRFVSWTFQSIIDDDQKTTSKFLHYLAGSNQSFSFEIWLLVCVVVQIVQNQEIGFNEKAEIYYENVNLAFVRKKLNNDLKNIFDEQDESDDDDDEFEKNVKEVLPTLNLDLDLQKISQNPDILQEVEKKFTEDLDRFTIQDLSQQSFRLFSVHNKKIGIDIYPYISAIQMIIAIYILLFYSAMEGGGFSSSGSSLQFNQFSGSMVVVLFFQIGFVLWDRRIIMLNNGLREADRAKNPNDQDAIVEEELKKKKKTKFLENKHSVSKPKKKASAKANSQPKKKKKKEDLPALDMKIVDYNQNNLGISIHATTKQKSEPYWKYSTFNKYILLIFLMVLVHLFIYYYLPNIATQTSGAPLDIGNISNNTPAIIFYAMYSIYFMLSAFQIKYGIPYFKGKNYLMNAASSLRGSMFAAYRALPFIFEIRTFLDWTFTKTALDLFQWIKFEIIFSTLFTARCKWIVRQTHIVGNPIKLVMKITQGGIAIIGLIGIIFGPLLIFSTLNPLLETNPVIGTSVTIGLQIDDNYYSIFSASHVSNIGQADANITEGQSVLQGIDMSTLQTVTMAISSDTNWDIAAPSRQLLVDTVSEIATMIRSGATAPHNMSLLMDYQFTQNMTSSSGGSPTKLSVNYKLLNSTNQTNDLVYIEALSAQLSCNGTNSVFYVPRFYQQLIRIAPLATPISYPGTNDSFYPGISLKLNNCSSTSYWTVGLTNVTAPDGSLQIGSGLSFHVISNKIFRYLMSFSVSAFYLTVVLVLGQNLRSGLTANQLNVQYLDIPKADNLLQICEGILIARADQNLEKEEMLYWELLDLCRSPEVFKKVTDSCVAEMKKNKPKVE